MGVLAALAVLLAGQELTEPNSVTVRIESPKPVTLVEVLDRKREVVDNAALDTVVVTSAGREVCVSPCDALVPRAGDYLVAAANMVPSVPFSVRGRGDRVTVTVSPGSPLMKSLSRAAVVVALMLVGGGVLFVAWGTQGTIKAPQLAVGATALTLGVAAGVLGLVLGFGPARTNVTVE